MRLVDKEPQQGEERRLQVLFIVDCLRRELIPPFFLPDIQDGETRTDTHSAVSPLRGVGEHAESRLWRSILTRRRGLVSAGPFINNLSYRLLKATSAGTLKLAQNILFFGATSLTS